MKRIFIISALLFLGMNLIAQIPTNGLIAHYPFNTNINDESGNNLTGTNYGAILTTDRFGNPDNAYYFNGFNSYIELGNNENFNPSNISLCCWFNTDYKTNSIMQLLRWRNYGFSLSFYGSNKPAPNGLLVSYYSGAEDHHILNDQTNMDYADGLWHLAVFTYDSICGKLYIDNKLVSSEIHTIKSPLYYQPGGMAIGRDGDNDGFYYNGKIDDIRIYNMPLGQAEISNLYYEGICKQSVTVTDTLVINANISTFNPLSYKNVIKIFPNPANTSLVIDLGENFEVLKNYKIKISNSAGQSVYESTINEKQEIINLSLWTGKGIYIIDFTDESNTIFESKKIVLQ